MLFKKKLDCAFFSTHFSVFGYPDETLFLVFVILRETFARRSTEKIKNNKIRSNYIDD